MTATLRTGAIAALLLVLTACQSVGISIERGLAPRAELWPRWKAHDPRANAIIDHGAWTRILAKYVRPGGDGVARVAYRQIDGQDRAALADYLRRLQAVPIAGHGRSEQLAYWINLYNALTVDVVLRHYPVASILDIDLTPGLLSRGPWDAKLVVVAGASLSLNDIEHRIVRPIWRDPRIHYALNCAAVGCPDLAPAAYTGATVEHMLDAAARAYIGHARGVTVGAEGLTLSKIYAWYAEDFGGRAGLVDHLARYAPSNLAPRLAATPVAAYIYDWALSEQP